MILTRSIFHLFLAGLLALPLVLAEHGFPQAREIPTIDLHRSTAKGPLPPLGLQESSSGLVDLVGRKMARQQRARRQNDRFDKFIKKVAVDHGVSPALVKAVIRAESNFNPHAVSAQGAVGLMQVLPATARRVGVSNPADPQSNITAGVRYLKTLLIMFNQDEALALAAYNSGPARVKRAGGVPPIRETQAFVARVMSYYRSYLNL